MRVHPTVSPTGPEVLPMQPPPGTVERALHNPQMAGEVANVVGNTRMNFGNLANQISPGAAPNFASTALPALALLGGIAIISNGIRMIVSGKQHGIITGREGKLV